MSFSYKLIIILVFGFIFSNEVKAQIYFPEGLEFDPYNQQFSDLNIKKIEQFSFTENKIDTLKTKIDSMFAIDLDCVIYYDSPYKISKIKYNFEHITPNFQNDSINNYKINFNNISCEFWYDENNCTYGNYGELLKVETKKHSGYSQIIDGIYSKPGIHKDETKFINYSDEGKLIRSEHYKGDILFFTADFIYEPFYLENKNIQLLTTVRQKWTDNSRKTIFIKYYF